MMSFPFPLNKSMEENPIENTENIEVIQTETVNEQPVEQPKKTRKKKEQPK